MSPAKKSKKKTPSKTARKAGAKRPAGKKAARNKPVVRKQAAKKPAAGKKAAKKPAAPKQAAKKPAKKPTAPKQAAKKPAAERVAAKKAEVAAPPPGAPIAPIEAKPKRPSRKKTVQPVEREAAQADPLGLATPARPSALSKLGTKYACYKCAAKFYDLNRPEPLCPKCGADQREAPKKIFRPRGVEPEVTARRDARRMAPLLDDDEDVAVIDKEEELDIGLGVVDADDELLDDEDDLDDSDDDTL